VVWRGGIRVEKGSQGIEKIGSTMEIQIVDPGRSGQRCRGRIVAISTGLQWVVSLCICLACFLSSLFSCSIRSHPRNDTAQQVDPKYYHSLLVRPLGENTPNSHARPSIGPPFTRTKTIPIQRPSRGPLSHSCRKTSHERENPATGEKKRRTSSEGRQRSDPHGGMFFCALGQR
jgi:hypothetical protein